MNMLAWFQRNREDLTSEEDSILMNSPITTEAEQPQQAEEKLNRWSVKKFFQYTGPGWLMSIAFLDPGNLESDLQSGAVAGYSLIWLLFTTHLIGLFIQVLAARLGTVTGFHLAEHVKRIYPRPIAMVIWFVVELAIIGSDIQEIIGTAIALQVIFRFPIWVGVLITSFDSFLFLFIQQFGVRKMEAFFVALIAIMGVCFWIEMLLSQPEVTSILHGLFVPSIPSRAVVQAVGMVGAVIMPHNIFLHSALVMSRKVNRTDRRSHSVKEANHYFALESAIALLFSFLINLAIVVVFAKVFYDPNQMKEIPGLFGASTVLSKTLGNGAKYLWAIGLFAAGQSSTMTGTMAGQFVIEGFWNLEIKPWQRILLTRSIALIPSMVVALAASNHLDNLGEWLNVLQSIDLPFALIPVLKITSSRTVMGSYMNRRISLYFGSLLSLLILAINFYLVFTFFTALSDAWFVYFGIILFLIPYASLLIYLGWFPIDKMLKLQQLTPT